MTLIILFVCRRNKFGQPAASYNRFMDPRAAEPFLLAKGDIDSQFARTKSVLGCGKRGNNV